jgi:probable HAF family extracellular repeat protein
MESTAQTCLAGRAARLRGAARASAAAVATGTVAGALLLAGGSAFAATASHHAATAASYTFTTLDNQADPTFNQLLGINSHDVISGYFGAGTPGHPNKGYLLDPPYAQANYVNENFPGSAQTQVTGLNNLGDTSGFWVSANGTNHGFVEWNGVFASYNDPKTPHMKGSVNQLLGVNNSGVAVGFYNDAAGNSHAYQVNQATSVYTAIKIPGSVSTAATGINNNGDIVGTAKDASGTTSSWLLHDGHLTTYQFPGGSDTQAFGVNNKDQIVGSYTDGGGVSHGFVLSKPLGPVSHWQSIDDPNGVGSTVVNGINNNGDLVGFYTDAAGNTDGMLAQP